MWIHPHCPELSKIEQIFSIMSILLAQAPAPDLAKAGSQQFTLCAACHGQQGEGTAAAPPLAGSEWVNGPVENLIRIQLRGLIGPIKVKGQEYSMPGGMAALAYQNDDQIAGVLTYIRSNLGNDAPAVTAEQVAALRSEVGQPQLVAADLVPPKKAVAPPMTETGAPVQVPSKYADMSSPLGLPIWLAIAIPIFAFFCFINVFKKQP